MKIDKTLIEKLARLSKLNFDDEQAQAAIKADLENITRFFNKINELDTEGIEPLVYLSEEQNRFRPDEAKSLITKEEALLNAPLKNENYFKVPKVIS